MKQAVFLDRDGTLIELVHHLARPEDVRLIAGAAKAVRRLRDAGWLVVIVTNQSVIGRGKLTGAGLERIHERLQGALRDEGTEIDAVYFCPTAPVSGDPTVVEDTMRKPGPGMLLQAAKEHHINLAASWMIGDSVSDILAGNKAGCRTLLVRTGYGNDYGHDTNLYTREATDLWHAADIILREN